MPLWGAIKGFFNSYKNSKLSIKELIAYCLYFTIYPVRIWRLKTRYSFIDKKYLNDIEWIKKSAKSYLSIQKLQLLEIFNLQLPHLLRYEDKNSMRHSVEARLPFLDYKLLEASLSINSLYKIKDGWTKYILRMAMEKILPDNVVWRKNKLGFNAPEKTWMESILPVMKVSIEKSKIIKSITVRKIFYESLDKNALWRLYSIAMWEELFEVKPD